MGETFKSILSSVVNKRYEDLVKENSRAISTSFKLCSFSERNDSMLMWAHYASYHQGFCIEYDIESIPYTDYRRRFLYPTIYSDFMFDATEYYKIGVEDENFNNLYLSMVGLVKGKEWQYEKEWRLVFSHEILEKEKSYVWGKSKAVYLGSKIEISDQDMLIEICNDKDIPIFKMKAHHNKFLLEVTDL